MEQACRAPLNKALCSVLRISARTLADVPARSFTSCYTTLPRFVSWSFMFPPPKPFPPQQRCSLSLFVTAVKGNGCFKHLQFFSGFSPCRSITFLLNVVTELTEYNCQSVCVNTCSKGTPQGGREDVQGSAQRSSLHQS